MCKFNEGANINSPAMRGGLDAKFKSQNQGPKKRLVEKLSQLQVHECLQLGVNIPVDQAAACRLDLLIEFHIENVLGLVVDVADRRCRGLDPPGQLTHTTLIDIPKNIVFFDWPQSRH